MVIKGYKITREIHRGAITTVYEAIQESLQRRVLLKVLNKQWLTQADLLERFQREARICARLDHPNIVKIFDYQADQSQTYLSMEYIDGLSLSELLQDKPLDRKDFDHFSRQVLEGIAYAHNQGVLHRDIKPDNIMVAEDGTIKITDFGLASFHNVSSVTDQGTALGSPAYMAPEIIKGEQATVKSDLFAVGVTLYEMCFGQNPFQEENVGATIQNVLLNPAPFSNELIEDCDQALQEILTRLLSKNSASRPESAAIVLMEWNTLFGTAAIPGSAPLLPADSGHQSKWSLQKRAAIFILLPLALIFTYQLLNKNPEERELNPTQADTVSIPNSQVKIGGKSEEKKEHELPQPVPTIPEFDTKDDNESAEPESKRLVDKTASQPASLFILAKPWALIKIDGQEKGITPLSEALPLAQGSYDLELSNPGFQTIHRTITLNSAQSETLQVRLEPMVGFVEIRVKPWASLKIDDQPHGNSPFPEPFVLRAGSHRLEFHNPKTGVLVDTIQVVANERLRVQYDLIKKSGTKIADSTY